MGNIPGMPNVPLEDINRIAGEVMTTFSPLYVKHYALALVDKLKSEAEPEEPGPWKLSAMPTPSEPLKEGWMTKRAGTKDNWKRRWFVALNEQDNFKIYYFEKEALKSDVTKAKGCIQLSGYKVKNLDKEEEVKEFGEHSFTCKPSSRRRQWYIRADNEADRKEWASIFKYAASRAGPPLNSDEVMATAFKEAYRELRWALGIWGSFSYNLTEEEQLAALIVDKLEDEIMGPVYAEIPSGRMERKIKEQIQLTLDRSVGAVVAAAWKAVVGTIDAAKGSVEKAAKDSIGVIFEKQAELKGKIGEGILSIIQPPLDELTKPVMTPVNGCLMAPLVAAYTGLIKGFHAEVSKCIADGLKEEDWKDLERRTRYWWGMPMYPALYNIYKAFREGYTGDEPETAKVSLTISVNVGDIIDLIPGVSVWRIEDAFEGSLRAMMQKALYTFKSEHEAGGGKVEDATAVLNATMGKFAHDAKAQIVKDIQGIFIMALQPPFKQKVDPLIEGVLSPITELIPEALTTFLDVAGMATDVMDGVLTDCIKSAVAGASGDAVAPVTALAGELGFVEAA